MSPEEHKERLRELILDEEQIVTALSLAVDLKINLKDATQLLNDFVNDPKHDKAHFSTTYMVTGELKGTNPSYGIFLIKSEEEKNVFANINHESIHSVCKSPNVSTGSTLEIDFEAGKLIDDISYLGCPVGKKCIRRTAKPKAVAPQEAQLTNGNSTSKESAKTEKKTEENGQVSASNTSPKAKETKPKPKSRGIASFFTQNPNKTEASKKPTSPKKADSPKIEENVNKTATIDMKMEVEENTESKPAEDVKESKTPKKINSNKENKKKKTKKVSESSKKRKRIQQMSDSESSSDIFDEDDELDEEMPNMLDDDEPPPTKPSLPATNKRRKVVDKTFMDEDGFMVTTTEYMYEEVPEEQVEKPKSPKPVKAEVKEPALKRTASNGTEKKTEKGKKGKKPVSGSQPTLMSFFKKQ